MTDVLCSAVKTVGGGAAKIVYMHPLAMRPRENCKSTYSYTKAMKSGAMLAPNNEGTPVNDTLLCTSRPP